MDGPQATRPGRGRPARVCRRTRARRHHEGAQHHADNRLRPRQHLQGTHGRGGRRSAQTGRTRESEFTHIVETDADAQDLVKQYYAMDASVTKAVESRTTRDAIGYSIETMAKAAY